MSFLRNFPTINTNFKGTFKLHNEAGFSFLNPYPHPLSLNSLIFILSKTQRFCPKPFVQYMNYRPKLEDFVLLPEDKPSPPPVTSNCAEANNSRVAKLKCCLDRIKNSFFAKHYLLEDFTICFPKMSINK